MVLLKDVKMKYPGSRAETLRDIDLTIQDGEFVFLVGPSGSGKTTIIKLLTGEIRATGGQIEVNGFDLRTMKRRNLPKLRRSLGVIFQDYRLIKDMTVYENVAFAMRVIGASNREIKKRVPYVLDLVDLSGREDRYPRELSGGEQQRVAIARALVNSPDMIIADEPTGNLDPRQKSRDHAALPEDQRAGNDGADCDARKGACQRLFQARCVAERRLPHQRRNGWVLRL